MELLEKMKKIANALRSKHGGDAAHQFELAVLTYLTTGEQAVACDHEPICSIWGKVRDILDEGNIDSKVYVSDVVDMRDMRRGKLNLVYAPCGSGKTYFVENVLKNERGHFKGNMLYLAPTVALVRALKFRGESYLTPDGHGYLVREWRHAGITAMTYAAFGAIIKREREAGTYDDAKLWNDHTIICADELSQGVSQSNYTDRHGNRIPDGKNVTKIALEELEARIKNEGNLVVTVSATPRRLIGKYFQDVRMVGMYLNPRGYRDGTVVRYSDLDALLDRIDPAKRGLIYIGRVTQMLRAVERLESRGIHAAAIYSRNYEKTPMRREQLEAVESLEMDERIPDGIQVLIINAAYETGLNIRPEKSHLDYVIVHDVDPDTQIQARGRYRGDIDTVYHKDALDGETVSIDFARLSPYIGKTLRAPEKKQLLSELGLKDSRGRPMGWPAFVKLLKEQGHAIEEGKDRTGRYYVIAD